MEVRPLAAPSAPEVEEEVLVLDCPIGMVFLLLVGWLCFCFVLVGEEVSARGAYVNKVGKVGGSVLLRLAYICIYLHVPYMYLSLMICCQHGSTS